MKSNVVRQVVVGLALTETLKTFPLTYDAHEQFFDLVSSVQRRAADMGLSFHLAVTTVEILSAMEDLFPTLYEVTIAMLLVQQHRTGYEEHAYEGLSPAEVVVRDLLVEAHRAFMALDEQHRDEFHDWTIALGQLRHMVHARPKLRRLQRED